MSKTSKPKTKMACSCGCGALTANAFAPGHDNRYYGQVVRGERPVTDLDIFPGLLRKWQGRLAKEAAKALAAGGVEPRQESDRPVPGDDAWTEDQPNQTTGPTADPKLSAKEVKDGRWWYPVRAVRPLDDGRYEVDWKAKNGNVRTSRVEAAKLR